MPSSRIMTRSPSKPRITGRLVPGPELRLATPGSFSSTSPREDAFLAVSSNDSMVFTVWNGGQFGFLVSGGGYGDVFVDSGKPQLEIAGHSGAAGDIDALVDLGKRVQVRHRVIAARSDAGELINTLGIGRLWSRPAARASPSRRGWFPCLERALLCPAQCRSVQRRLWRSREERLHAEASTHSLRRPKEGSREDSSRRARPGNERAR